MSGDGTVYFEFIAAELDREVARRAALDSRATGVVTTSGALATLVLGLGTFLRGAGRIDYSSPWVSVLGLSSALAFVIAAVLAILGGRLIAYSGGPDKSSLNKLRIELWNQDESTARNIVCWYRIATLTSLRAGSNRKAAFIQGALIAQVAAVVSLAVATGFSLAK